MDSNSNHYQSISTNHASCYSVEDTNEGCYRDISSSLSSRGWKRVNYSRYLSNIEKKIRRSSCNKKDNASFIWTIAEKGIDFNELQEYQIVNHFEGITKITTKIGYCEILYNMKWINQDMYDISPRSYNLGDPTMRDEFIEDFKITAAVNMLKYYYYYHYIHRTNSVHSTTIESKGLLIDKRTIKSCIACVSQFLRVKLGGEWPGVERTFPCPDDGGILYGLTDKEWNALLACSYKIIEYDKRFIVNNKELLSIIDSSNTCNNRSCTTSKLIKVQMLLQSILKCHKQSHYVDGMNNVWIIKAPDTCCGVGMKLSHNLEAILECEQGMGGRNVQKYIENPLLASLGTGNGSTTTGNKIKFDLRIWVLVTSFEPLQAYIYSTIYGRHCQVAYDSSIKHLNDHSVHLTNYSIQRKGELAAAVASTDGNTNSSSAATGNTIGSSKLKGSVGIRTIKKLRKETNSVTATATAADARSRIHSMDIDIPAYGGISVSDRATEVINNETSLLLNHQEIMHIVGEDRWRSSIWPKIRRKVDATLTVTYYDDIVKHRDKSFQFLGYDVILDEAYEPYILEINMSPALAHRCDSHNAVIADMAEEMIDLVTGKAVGVDARCGSWERLCASDATPNALSQTHSSAVTPNIATQSIRTPTPSGSNRSSNSDEWTDRVKPKTVRPKSASSTMSSNRRCRDSNTSPIVYINCDVSTLLKNASNISSSSGSNAYSANNSNAMDLTFALIGRGITLSAIDFHDRMCSHFHSLLTMQRWGRKCLARLRAYHRKRDTASIVIQTHSRRHRAMLLLVKMRTNHMAVVVQCGIRVYLAKKRTQSIRHNIAAITIQCLIRCRNSYHKLTHTRRVDRVDKIKRWYRHTMDVYRRRNAFKLVSAVRGWYNNRNACAKVIGRAINGLYCRKRTRYTIKLCRCIRGYICKKRLNARIRRRKCRMIAMQVVDRLQQVNEYNQRIAMVMEDAHSRAIHIDLKLNALVDLVVDTVTGSCHSDVVDMAIMCVCDAAAPIDDDNCSLPEVEAEVEAVGEAAEEVAISPYGYSEEQLVVDEEEYDDKESRIAYISSYVDEPQSYTNYPPAYTGIAVEDDELLKESLQQMQSVMRYYQKAEIVSRKLPPKLPIPDTHRPSSGRSRSSRSKLASEIPTPKVVRHNGDKSSSSGSNSNSTNYNTVIDKHHHGDGNKKQQPSRDQSQPIQQHAYSGTTIDNSHWLNTIQAQYCAINNRCIVDSTNISCGNSNQSTSRRFDNYLALGQRRLDTLIVPDIHPPSLPAPLFPRPSSAAAKYGNSSSSNTNRKKSQKLNRKKNVLHVHESSKTNTKSNQAKKNSISDYVGNVAATDAYFRAFNPYEFEFD